MLQSNRDLAMGWISVPHVGETEALRGWDVELEAPVVVGGWADVETIGCMGHPGCTGCRVIINKCFSS
jgi:hypothetical protein